MLGNRRLLGFSSTGYQGLLGLWPDMPPLTPDIRGHRLCMHKHGIFLVATTDKLGLETLRALRTAGITLVQDRSVHDRDGHKRLKG